MHKHVLLTLAVLLSCCFYSVSSIGQQVDPDKVDILEGELKSSERNIAAINSVLPEVEAEGNYSRGIVYFVFLIGLLIAAVEKYGSPSFKVAVVIMGVLVSAAEGARMNFFPHDHGTIAAKIPKIQNLLRIATDEVSQIKELDYVGNQQLFNYAQTEYNAKVSPSIAKAFEHLSELGFAVSNEYYTVRNARPVEWNLISAAYAKDSSERNRVSVTGKGATVDNALLDSRVNLNREVETMVEDFFATADEYQQCLLATDQDIKSAVKRKLSNYVSFFDTTDYSNLEVDDAGQYNLILNIDLRKDIDQAFLSILSDVIAKRDIDQACLSSNEGVYVGEWASSKYGAGGDMVIEVTADGSVLRADVERMTGSQFSLPHLEGPLSLGESNSITANLKGDWTEVDGTVGKGVVTAEYSFRFGFLRFLKDTGSMRLVKVADAKADTAEQ